MGGLDEKLFGVLYAAARRMLARARPAPGPLPGSVELAGLHAELSLLACAVAERRVELCGVAHAGSVCPPRILLPEHLRLSSDPAAAVRGYLARVITDASALATDLGPLRPLASEAERVLAALLTAAEVNARLFAELPAAQALLAETGALELSLRPALGALPVNSAALEALVQARLGRAFEPEAWPHDDSSRSWVREVLGTRVSDSAALHAALGRLTPFVRDARISPVLTFGGLDAPVPPAATLRTPDRQTPRQPGASERELRVREQVKRVQLSEREQENPLTHSFEKLHTADDYRGGNKRADGTDELAEHGPALDELELSSLTRTNQSAGSYARTDVELPVDPGETAAEAPATEAIAYDEWDERTRSYRRAHCNVYEHDGEERLARAEAQRTVNEVLARHAAEVRELSSELSRLRSARALRNRQPDGRDVDIDALVERHGALRSGHSPPDKLYLSRRRHERDLGVFLLLDASLSSDSWVAGSRVLDVAKDSLIVLSEVLHAERVPTAIAAFSSHTRKQCEFVWLKRFAQPWQDAHSRVLSLEPRGYTRIGPALRHATASLARERHQKQLLLLISDAKPTDYDRYEGRYGVADVHRALGEAEALGMSCFGLAIDARARRHLPEMFGRGRFQVLARPSGLSRALAGVYADLLR